MQQQYKVVSWLQDAQAAAEATAAAAVAATVAAAPAM